MRSSYIVLLRGIERCDAFRTAPPRGTSISDVEFAIRPMEVKCGGTGSDRFSFQWWHLNLPKPITTPDEVALAEAPSLGDVFSYVCTSRNGQFQVFWFSNLGWVDITTDYIRNTGRIRHPGYPDKDARILTWKSISKRSPSYVTENYFRTKKKSMGEGENLNMADYVKLFSKMTASGAESAVISSASGGD